ncbi:hypothetical protein Cantr_05077 [Candida viswanathii]|uniref:Uncharacterized protein n=1 Tax=Candida viswanathii TaxID=5486 RepID=A0A367XRW7_9ASCO|nr:hypothetical protein Cantr_05077 [Candida viswanathii]
MISDEWIRRLDLLDLTYLKTLCLPLNHLVYLSPEFLPSSLIALDVSHNGIFAFTDFETLTNLEQLDLSTTKLSRFLGLLRDKSYAFPDSIRFVNIEGFGLSYDGAEVLYGELAKKPHFEFLNLYEHPIDAQLVLGAGARLYKVGLLGDCSGFITVNELTRYRTRAPAQEKARDACSAKDLGLPPTEID